jgi:hypothetical protein
MSESTCQSMHRLSLLLKTIYRVRYNLVTEKKGSPTVVKAELDLLRVHNLITRHRNFCPHCKFDEALRGVSRLATRPRSNVIPINRGS